MRLVLGSILARVAASPDRDRLVLRGGVLTAAWCPARVPPDDLDAVRARAVQRAKRSFGEG